MNVQDVLKYGDNTLMTAIDRFPVEHRQVTGACGYWSVKDIAAHLTSYEIFLEQVLASIVDDSPIETLDAMKEFGKDFNDVEVEKRAEMSFDEVLAEYRKSHQRILEHASRISPETFRENGTIPWYGEDYCLNDFIVYTNYAHKREHVGQIDVFGDRVEG